MYAPPMTRRPSWLNLRAVPDGPRMLRLRGAEVADAFLERGAHEAARLRLPLRETVRLGEQVSLEISFGPMVDEVTLPAIVDAIDEADDEADNGALLVTLSIPLTERDRAEYVQQVLSGTRSAAARRHRRVSVDLEVRWTWNGSRYASRARDLSHGGAFIESRVLPTVGAKVSVELRLPDATPALALGAEVAWLRTRAGAPGFGVSFKLPDRSAASRLHDAVRECELA